jgi:two-component system cell cycle response regulator DivK
MNSVLLIEDDENNISLLQDMFAFDDIPAELAIAKTGEEALGCAARLLPALILMDLRLPGMDGMETTEILKANPLTSDIPVWATTAYAMKGDEERARAAGCCEYITKPVHGRELADRIRMFLKRHARKEVPTCSKQEF